MNSNWKITSKLVYALKRKIIVAEIRDYIEFNDITHYQIHRKYPVYKTIYIEFTDVTFTLNKIKYYLYPSERTQMLLNHNLYFSFQNYILRSFCERIQKDK